ncbi:hypothetical protein FNH22_13895 [Fulvivirga sp. M361]|uniref:hypothetical protein n=1 Tax=Fulvivirga sp. M361 TaxID=2594266 RepID=UPI00117AB22F|nr:hypothetical protein [Fulvivirga sp. M361]TRX58433.1 hypothetical protein FNH22_13895 [Fulvivirga sp. M361]
MEIDRTKYKVWDKTNFSSIHWILNPGLAINELILGQRVPKITLIDQTSDRPLMERTYIPCPHCSTLHEAQTWSVQNKTAFKNWFGLFCPNCRELIPCLRNLTSGLVLLVTYPFWFWWINQWKQKWLKSQPSRYSNLNLQPIEHKNVNWVKMGLGWGVIMFIIMSLFMPVLNGTDHSWTAILINFPIWVVGGLCFGYVMKWWMGKRLKKAKTPTRPLL